jgi:superoxide reductase
MKQLNELVKHDDWKTEKHVPVIDAPDSVMRNEYFTVSATVGKEVEHPNTVPHHIRWIQLYFLPDGKSTPIQVTAMEFSAHGEQAPDDDEKGIYTCSCASAGLKIDGPGTLMASAYCNIHGLWESSKPIACE